MQKFDSSMMDFEERVDIDDFESEVMERIYSKPLLIKRVNTTSQIAIVGANVCPVESLDYEVPENELVNEDWRSRRTVQIFQYILLKWAFALIIGLSTGLVGIFNNIAVENIAGFKLLLTTELMLKHKYYKAFAAYAGCNLGLATSAAALCAFIAPAAAGSGIPEVKAYLNGVDAYSILATFSTDSSLKPEFVADDTTTNRYPTSSLYVTRVGGDVTDPGDRNAQGKDWRRTVSDQGLKCDFFGTTASWDRKTFYGKGISFCFGLTRRILFRRVKSLVDFLPPVSLVVPG
ncbi:hypothetical protein GOBAR_AA24308 [Gossypium barbadense]|uniref:Chloride channel protein n=1 Tax=Gossypium barbadense TaxID=3634 RepID=A0A2P5WZ51_GOSBA|nr:hypothetical protein GOBAR_AA24308 [Gossypium barbadense]